MSEKTRKAVFFDIDGTLWDEKSYIPESTREGIRKLQEAGHYAFICTGRTKGFVRDERLLSLGFDGMIAGCGTYIECDGKELFYKKLDNETIVKGIEVLRKYKMQMILEGKNNLYMSKNDFAGDRFGDKLREELKDDLLSIEEYENQWEASKFSASGEDGEYQKALAELEGTFDFLVHGPFAIEFVPVGFSKASGIKKACELLDIRLEDTYAFGDSVNDLEMLRYVAHGVAMGNGTDEAKAAAEYVTTTLHEDGILNGLKHYGLVL